MARFKKKLVFLDILANELSLMGYQNLMQRQQNVELNRVQEQLKKYQLQLEDLVAQRTAALQQSNRQLSKEITQKTKIQKRQTRLTTAIESAAESIVITSTAGKIICVNPAFERLTGYSSREVVGKTPQILKSGYHDENFYRNLWRTILAGEVWTGRFTNRKKDGTLYQEESTISPVKNARGKAKVQNSSSLSPSIKRNSTSTSPMIYYLNRLASKNRFVEEKQESDTPRQLLPDEIRLSQKGEKHQWKRKRYFLSMMNRIFSMACGEC